MGEGEEAGAEVGGEAGAEVGVVVKQYKVVGEEGVEV